MSTLNQVSVELYEHVKYKNFDMACNLQKLIECYNCMMIKLYD